MILYSFARRRLPAEKYLENIEQEKFVVLALNTKNDIIARNEIFCGSLDASIVHPRDIKTLLKKTLLNYSFHIEYMYLM
ncbi:hypothetical protein H7K21_06135 [Cytobacillus firmus]|nr:hypothetical protein [Cytobacillus firmus]